MKRLKVKKFVLPMTLMIFGLLAMLTAVIMTNTETSLKSKETLNYVSSTIISQDIAVINTAKKIINPFTDQSVTVGKNYYDYKGTEEAQEKSIIYHANTYIQNSGVDFVYEQPFEVVAVYDGTVTNVKEDEVLGKIIEINHNNEYISVYQSLSEVNVKKGDIVSQGQVLGKSGTNELDKDLGNHLHFELYVGGKIVDPTQYLNKDVPKKSNKE